MKMNEKNHYPYSFLLAAREYFLSSYCEIMQYFILCKNSGIPTKASFWLKNINYAISVNFSREFFTEIIFFSIFAVVNRKTVSGIKTTKNILSY